MYIIVYVDKAYAKRFRGAFMFGHNTNDQITQDQQSDAHVSLPDDTLNDLTSSGSPTMSASQPAGAPLVQPQEFPAPLAAPTIQPQTSPDPGTYPDGSDDLNATAAQPTTPASTPEPTEPARSATHDDLLSLKQDALTSLSPLVHNLELEAEEKFKTLMMLIQASDNHSLVKEAYEAAQAIPDEKARAQALLDVVNEINYFTHNKNDSKPV